MSSNHSQEIRAIRRRYEAAVRSAVDWLESHGRSQSWLAKQIGVERSVLSRFLNAGDEAYSPHPDRPRMMTILEGIERICLPDTRDIFLSHSSKDKEFARKLVAEIEAYSDASRRLTIWFDEAEIQPGESIVGAVNRGLERSRYFGLLMTPEYFESKSGWTDAEWHSALHSDPDNRRGRFIPLLAADCPVIPVLLRHLLMIDLRGKKFSDGVTRLVQTLLDQPLPRPVTHRGQLIPTTAVVDRATLLAERTLPDADPDVVQENLYCNLLPVERLPQRIYIAPIAPQLKKTKAKGESKYPAKKDLINKIRECQRRSDSPEWTPSFRVHQSSVITFHDLEDPESVLSPVIDSDGIESYSTRSFLVGVENRKIVMSLLNMGIARHMTHPKRGLFVDPSRANNRFYFPSKDGADIIYTWMPVRRKVQRTVAKPYQRHGKVTAWMHHACNIQAIYLASQFYIQLRPSRLLTTDGKTVKGGPNVGKIVSRWLALERNIHVLYNVRFWTYILRSGPGPISIRVGDQRMEVSTIPAMVQQGYGIASDHRDLLGLLDLEAPKLAQLEDDFAAMEEAIDETDPLAPTDVFDGPDEGNAELTDET